MKQEKKIEHKKIVKQEGKEENILQMVIQKESWEEIIYYIVSLENLNPWDIDLVKLTDSFLKFIRATKELDFRIPAKIVFVAAVLLRLKSDYLSFFEEKEEAPKEQKPFEELGIDPNLIQLGYPVKRAPKRQVTLDELIYALKKALAVREKKIERKRIWEARLQAEISEEEDITKRIDKIMNEIEKLTAKLKKNKIEFSKIVKKWERNKIVETFIPLLHLEQDRKIKTEQEDYFKEIFISKLL